ncbi:MAG: efflux RND transporter periplasmic adaptor subunit, partial [Lachnospiraceae bacterium]|nr:efflux RND transporter periplasmic adaptor subunit [Lachnospiraceae bacterium]
SNTGINYYDITVSVISDGKEFYQDMTGSVTFITKEKKEVLYVSNRAVIRDGDKSYVQQWDKNGKIVRKEVETGFSDGVSVEIIKGLEEGEVVLIESKVTAE